MAVTKRTRYEVLRRDNHACRYCGQMAPEVKLTVDHVTPVALGGTDNPDNLVAACHDCNAGKSSTAPDAALVADVRADALRHAELTREAYKVLVERQGERGDYEDEFAEAWTSADPLPADWENSIGRWFEMGVPIDLVTDAAERVSRKQKWFTGTGRFTYMCGMVWNQVRMVDELAEAYRAVEGSFMSDEARCDINAAGWQSGWDHGYLTCASDMRRMDPLSYVVDKIDYPVADSWAAAS